jgi:hypothetical protein
MSSPAEERIRGKVETALRSAFPAARIVHELVVRQGSCRIDLAAITPTRLILVEVKSERDVLVRLERQYRQAREVADGFLVVTAAKHVEAAREVVGWSSAVDEDTLDRELAGFFHRRVLEATTNAPARLAMLWAGELRTVAETGRTAAREFSIRQAADGLTGVEVRRRVCAALRAREFPRADPPMTSELFPRPTRFER